MRAVGRLLLPLLLLIPAHARAFGLEDVAQAAQNLAASPYQDPVKVPDWLLGISYDQWRDIRFRPDRALWLDRKLPFTVQFFHPGLFYDRSVRIHEVTPSGVIPVAFSPDQFDYGHDDFGGRVPQDLGYAGFRIHYPINKPSYRDEVIVFLGASYFRAVARSLSYGISARGLAIDTALPSGEEFPWFREFWLVRPSPSDRAITLYALLDSPSATGAYRFTVAPGRETRVDVDLRLFLRRSVQKLGIAPLTSMFLHGENSGGEFDDYRPEIHDSDGLLLASGTGEWIWRPLENPHALRVSSFEMEDPRGFGLLQRDRDFDHYQDLEASPHRRPSAWVEPKGSWGGGRVELIEIPTRRDITDTVVSFWVPDRAAAPGRPLSLAYSVSFFGDDPKLPPGGRVVATRRDSGTRDGAVRLVVDFEGPTLRALPADAVVEGVVSVTPATAGASEAQAPELVEQQVIRNSETSGWRLVFQIVPRTSDPIELRAFLRHGHDVLTETWSYLLVP